MDPKEDVHIGSFKVYLRSLAYNVELVEQLDIIDYRSEQIGMVNVSSTNNSCLLLLWTILSVHFTVLL